MKHTKYILICFLLAVVFTGCSNEEVSSEGSLAKGEGGLRMNVPTAQSFDQIEVVNTKSGFGVDPGSMMMIFSQKQANGSYSPYKSFATYNDFILAGMPFVMPVGDYSVTASSFDIANIADRVSEVPYFEGSRSFPVEDRQITNISSISCLFKSVGIEVNPSDRFKAKLQAEPNNYSYKIKVSNGTASWTFDSASTTAPAYFLDASTELAVRVSVVLDGESYPERVYYVNNSSTGKVSIGEYYIINIDSDTQDPTKSMSLSAKCINS